MKVIYTEDALRDLDAIADWLGRSLSQAGLHRSPLIRSWCDKRDHRIAGILDELRILPQLLQASRPGDRITIGFHHRQMARQCNRSIVDRFLKRVARGNTARQVGEADAVARVAVLVDQRDVTCPV